MDAQSLSTKLRQYNTDCSSSPLSWKMTHVWSSRHKANPRRKGVCCSGRCIEALLVKMVKVTQWPAPVTLQRGEDYQPHALYTLRTTRPADAYTRRIGLVQSHGQGDLQTRYRLKRAKSLKNLAKLSSTQT